MKKHIIGTIALALLSTSALSQQTGPNPYKDCGIGAALFANTPWAAVTSNVIWDVGTTAVVSATASPETCSGSTYKTAVFINETYESLEQDMIQGEGEFIDTLADIMSCDSDTAKALTAEVRQNIATSDLSISQTRLEKAESLYLNVMSTNAAKSCSTQS
ncbi:DUF3015 family protein [Glaciecola sp. XM2]|jgi:hypothetical protein|uniref:DUF3015 family protein n=1 Tax=Glaciecola sp. XM2 TaxID=1914931 RepID=UPI001BDE6DBC|nr:DUF3015 family protein [Glaciecola sp. XM2]MBT1450148.1 DUF3015 family protein [Glaciecola sp. XM2]